MQTNALAASAADSTVSTPSTKSFATDRYSSWHIWLLRAALLVVALLVLWALAWLAVPPLLKSQVQKIASEKLGRPVTIGAIIFKPWSLELTSVTWPSPNWPPRYQARPRSKSSASI